MPAEKTTNKGANTKKEGERRMEVVKDPDSTRNQDFTQLVEQYQTTLRRMCCAILRDEELAKGAVQEAFFKAHQSMGAFRGDCSEKTWLTLLVRVLTGCWDHSALAMCNCRSCLEV